MSAGCIHRRRSRRRRSAATPKCAKRLEDACPVDIYAAADGGVEIVEENLDECILCELCVEAAPPGKVRVLKLYSGEALER